ncbi:hypothetical protein [Cohnella sp.]|uniref:hypothetical protein n=1 Tax=Cohnella sp. TaxID=1883426 RepID=UPI0035695400
MSSGKRKIAKSWFGFQVRETEAYIRKLESMQRFEAEEVEAKLRAQRYQNEQLKAKLDEMKQKTLTSPLSLEKTSLLLERLERSVEAIERQGEAEAESLRRLQERKLERHARRMSEWDKQFDDYRKALDFLMEEASSLILKVRDKQEPEAADQLELEAAEAMQVRPERKANEDGREREEFLDEVKEAGKELEMNSRAKILQFKFRSILNEAAAAEEEVGITHSPMTADGMTMKEQSDLKDPTAKPVTKKISEKTSSSFWGDLEPYLEENELYVPKDELEEFVAPLPSVEFSEVKTSVTEEERAALLGMGESEQSTNISQESPGLSDEIHSIQNRYIVGKAAGDNLYAADGRLIIAKGQRITNEVVQAAEREGKLPDLIVHMVIPGFGADES